MRFSTVPAMFLLAALATLGACKCASSESPPGPTVGTSSEPPVTSAATPASTVAAAPTAVATEEPACSPWCNQPPAPGSDESGCPAVVDHPGLEGEIFGSWKEIVARLRGSANADEAPWDKLKPGASDAEIRRALTGKPDGAASVWLIGANIGLREQDRWHLVSKRSDGKLALFFDIATQGVYGACPSRISAALETKGMPRLIIDEDLFAPVPAGERYACDLASYVRKTLFLDVKASEIPLAIEQKASAENDAKPAWVKIVQQKDGVKITGAGCDLEEPLRL